MKTKANTTIKYNLYNYPYKSLSKNTTQDALTQHFVHWDTPLISNSIYEYNPDSETDPTKISVKEAGVYKVQALLLYKDTSTENRYNIKLQSSIFINNTEKEESLINTTLDASTKMSNRFISLQVTGIFNLEKDDKITINVKPLYQNQTAPIQKQTCVVYIERYLI